jgi:hypothetical protein
MSEVEHLGTRRSNFHIIFVFMARLLGVFSRFPFDQKPFQPWLRSKEPAVSSPFVCQPTSGNVIAIFGILGTKCEAVFAEPRGLGVLLFRWDENRMAPEMARPYRGGGFFCILG